jgi:phosphatidylserine/phosphatidylglycerophosphate/cardiolipin synthase-like enzyme
LVLEPSKRREALLSVIASAKRRLVLSLFRCDDLTVLDALASALERGCDVEAILTKRAKGGKKRLKKLWGALEEMGAVVTWFADPVVKYHAKYVVADEQTAVVTTLNPTERCFSRTWDALLITHDTVLVRGLLALFRADTTGAPLPGGRAISARLIVGPERSRAEYRRLISSAKRSIRILDHKLSDPDLVMLLRERRAEGITVSVVGHQALGLLEPHGKMMILDESRAVMGSTALSTLSLDFRREVSVIIENAALVKQLNGAYQQMIVKAGPSASYLPGDHSE